VICNILCVGTELLLGQIVDTNSSFIAEQLADAGIESYEQRTVGDNPQRIAHVLTSMLGSADAVIVTGGLGPTHDDITREVVAEMMGVELHVDENVMTHMKSIFERRNKDMPESNMRQAMVPEGATVIMNALGTAPGLICPVADKFVYLTPGVPHEMKPMVTESIIDHITKQQSDQHVIVTRTLKSWGLSESELADMLADFVEEGESGSVKIGFLARGINGIYIKLSTSAPTHKDAEILIEPVEIRILEMLADHIYATDDETMETIVIDLLQKRSLKLAIAESLTGGMISSRLVDPAGASDVLLGCVVAYDPAVKNNVLEVKVEDVYSDECAQQMADGVRKHLGADIAISTTGVAGPGPDDGHPQGEVFIGISTKEKTFSQQLRLGGDRQRVREYATISAMNLLRQFLLNSEVASS
jgi:nicotinamide-nucleotide amidase